MARLGVRQRLRRRPGFDAHIGNLEELLAPYEPARLVVGDSHAYEIEANWKIITENYHECYHCPQIHPELCRVTPTDSGESYDTTGDWVGGSMDLNDDAATMSLSGESGGVPSPGSTRGAGRSATSGCSPTCSSARTPTT